MIRSITLTILICSCSKYQVIKSEDIVSVHPVFRDTTFNHFYGYRLRNGACVDFDKQNTYVKQYLAENTDSLNSIEEDSDTDRILRVIQNKNPFKPIPLPVKVLPFREFGYVKTKEGKVIFYGLGTNTFHDLTSNYVYH